MKILLLISILILSSCSFFESDYDKLMNPIKEMKLAEKKAGKPNPTFDGVVEPDFPDEKLNNETLEGVDSNKDGVRDDVEIWINRVAEDEYVRWTMKDYYRKSFILYKAFDENQSESEIHQKLKNTTEAMNCWSWMARPYDVNYIESNNKDPREKKSNQLDQVIIFSQRIKILNGKFENYQINGTLGANGDKYCSESKVNNRYFELKSKY